MTPMLAASIITVNSGDWIHSLFWLFIIIVVAGIIWWLGNYFFGPAGFSFPAIVLKVWTMLFILLGAIVLINFLLSLGGHPLFPM